MRKNQAKKKCIFRQRAFFFLLGTIVFFNNSFGQGNYFEEDYVKYIDPFICTANDHGQTDVSASVPFGMIKPGPDTYPLGHSGYDYTSNKLLGFSHTRFSGVGCDGVGGDIRVLPLVGEELSNKPQWIEMIKSKEKASAGYYYIELVNGVKVQITADRQTAFHEYTFTANEESQLKVNLKSSFIESTYRSCTIDSDKIVSGEIQSKGICGNGKYRLFYAICIDKQDIHINQDGDNVLFTFIPEKNEKILFKCTLSSVSEENARNNLNRSKNIGFNEKRSDAELAWSNLINRIKIDCQDIKLKRIFYTHLYHSCQSPFQINDFNGEYRGSDGQKYVSDIPHYHGWSIWDTFRTKMPLFSLWIPDQYSNMLTSIKDLYIQGKTDWPTMNEPGPTVRTEHTIPLLLDSYKKGLLKFSLSEIYGQLKNEVAKLSFNSPDKILESSYDLWAMSEISKILGNKSDYKKYNDNAFKYKETWEKYFKVMRGNSDIMHGDGLYEGTLWQYRWFVPFDISGIQRMVGGEKYFETQLDYFFENELFNIGNQPNIQVPYLYFYTKSTWKTQRLIDQLINKTTNNWYGTHEKWGSPDTRKIFTDTPDGFIKEMDDDDGTMSSWFVLSAMGLYPEFTGSTKFLIISPQFDAVSIQLPENKTFCIKTLKQNEQSIYIQKARLNGQEIQKLMIDYKDVMRGGVLDLILGDSPLAVKSKSNVLTGENPNKE